jgi:hypothetical protein
MSVSVAVSITLTPVGNPSVSAAYTVLLSGWASMPRDPVLGSVCTMVFVAVSMATTCAT